MRLLGIDAALGRCSAAVLDDGRVLAERVHPGGQGQSAVLAGMVAAVLAEAGLAATVLDGVVVSLGPGSFTGLRAAIALAQGVAAGAGVPLVGVTVAEALAAALPDLAPRSLWVAIDSRRGRVFIDRPGDLAAFDVAAVPMPAGPVALAGDAATDVACRLAARGADVMLTAVRQPLARHVALAGARRLCAGLPAHPVQPVYVDPPEAKLPASPRPPPQ